MSPVFFDPFPSPLIAKVVVDVAVDKEFDYLIPDALLAQVKLGSRVSLSFG